MPESILKRQIKDYITSIGGFWSAVKGGAHSKTGDPDLIVCYKGRFIAIEGKTDVGVQSEWQKVRQEEIVNAGGIYILARSLDEVKERLGEIS